MLDKHISWNDHKKNKLAKNIELLKVHQCRFENLTIYLCLYKNNATKISYS